MATKKKTATPKKKAGTKRKASPAKRKPAVKKKSVTKKVVTKAPVQQTANVMPFSQDKIIKIVLIIVAVIFAFSAIDLLVQYLNNDYSAAVVNGERIPKSDFYERLEVAYGEAAVATLIDEVLIEQEANVNNIEASTEEIDAKLQEVEDSIGGPELLEQALESSNISMEQLRKQIMLDILATKILEPGLEYTEDDIVSFFDQYKELMYPEADPETLKYEDKKDEVRQAYVLQEVEREKFTWLEQLRIQAAIMDNVKKEPTYGWLKQTRDIISGMTNKTEE